MPGTDFYGDPLEGIVPVKIGGTEDSAEKKMEDGRAELGVWSNIIRVAIMQMGENGEEFRPTRNALAQWIEKQAADPNANCHARIMAAATGAGITSWSERTIRRKLSDLFFPKGKDGKETKNPPHFDFPTDDDGQNLRLVVKGVGGRAIFDLISTPVSTLRYRANHTEK